MKLFNRGHQSPVRSITHFYSWPNCRLKTFVLSPVSQKYTAHLLVSHVDGPSTACGNWRCSRACFTLLIAALFLASIVLMSWLTFRSAPDVMILGQTQCSLLLELDETNKEDMWWCSLAGSESLGPKTSIRRSEMNLSGSFHTYCLQGYSVYGGCSSSIHLLDFQTGPKAPGSGFELVWCWNLLPSTIQSLLVTDSMKERWFW